MITTTLGKNGFVDLMFVPPTEVREAYRELAWGGSTEDRSEFERTFLECCIQALSAVGLYSEDEPQSVVHSANRNGQISLHVHVQVKGTIRWISKDDRIQKLDAAFKVFADDRFSGCLPRAA